jgi:mycothiol synthase
MIEVRVCDDITSDDVAAVRALCDDAERVDGHPALNDDAARALEAKNPRTRLLVASDDATVVGALALFPRESVSAGSFASLLVVHPDHRDLDIDTALVRIATEEVRRAGGTHLQLLVIGADETADAWAAASRFEPEREFHEMRVSLPLSEAPRWPEGTTVRAFVPDQDERAWLDVNARAFAWDRDQGSLDESGLRERMAEPWFDLAGFLLAVDTQGIAGFCWTKIHPAEPPREPERLGEIYVIAVDPDRQGAGLGRALVVAGLASMHERGVRTGMLFVDGANTAAVALYRTLGFATSRVDRVYGLGVR